MDSIKLDFEQARAKHLLFKSRLRSILYGIEIDEAPVLSHFECSVGKWIYGHALKAYGHIPEMQELEKVHADIHTSAKELVTLYKYGKVDEARIGLTGMEKIADHLVELLTVLEKKLNKQPQPAEAIQQNKDLQHRLDEFQDILNANIELDKRMKEQVRETELANARYEKMAIEARAAEERLKQSFEDLEVKVKFRNLELEKENQALKEQIKELEKRLNG